MADSPTYPDHIRWTPNRPPPDPPPVDIWADPTAAAPPDAPCWPGCPRCTEESGNAAAEDAP